MCSRTRLEETQADQEIVQCSGDVAGLIPGCAFTLTKYPRQDQNRQYRVVSTAFDLTSDEYESRGGRGAGFSHFCSFTATDNQRPYRLPRITPKPTVLGPQTAIVTGPAGEEIWTDKYGRVKVQFHWDRQGKRDENSSCWVPVSHPWAGKGWGAVAIPRIGQEVIVEFFEGDPDRPIITGRVYNAEAIPPYGLPGGAVISGLKSDSTKGGGYNEYVMDDTKGNELIREHAQYNKDTTVENNRKATIKSGNDTLTVETGIRDVKVKGNSYHTVRAGHRNVKVTGGDYRVEVTDAEVKIIGNTGVDIEGTSTVGVYIHGSPKIKLECGASTIEIDAQNIAMKSGTGQLILNAEGATLLGAIVKIN